MRWLLFFSLVVGMFLTCSIAQAIEVRTWTSGKHTLKATFVTVDGDTAVLRSAKSGKLVRVKVSKLSEEDQAYIKRILNQTGGPSDAGRNGDSDEDEATDGDKSKGDSSEGDDSDEGSTSKDSADDRPKGERRERDYELDPKAIMFAGAKGLVLPRDPSKWLNSPPITNESVGNKALIFIFFDEENRLSIPRKWPIWLKTATEFKGKPVIFIAVNSGNSRAVVQQSLQKYKVTWPTIVDTDRMFERHCNCRPLSKSQSWNVRTVDGEGTFTYGADELKAAVLSAMHGTKWRVEPKGLPSALKKAWTNIENGRFKAAAPDVVKALKSKKANIQRGGKKLEAAINYHIEGLVGEALYQEDEGNKFAALKIYKQLLADFSRYPLDERIKTTADRLAQDPALKEELAAMNDFLAAKKLVSRSKRRALAKLEKVIDEYPDTAAALDAEKLIDRIRK